MIQPIRRIGNSQGILLPRNILQACGIEEQVEIVVVGQAIILRSVKKQPRQGWEEHFQKNMTSSSSTEPDLFAGLENDFDSMEWTW